jgi:predicted dehydrogenase
MKRRAVIVGCGNMAAGWVRSLTSPALAGRVEICALVDRDPAMASRLQANHNLTGAVLSTDLAAVLAELKPDLVFDIAVPSARLDIVSTAVRAGCDVLTEKPMATSLEDAQRINALARETGRVHAVTQNRRYKTGIRRVRATLESGVIGDLTALHADFFIGAHFGGFREAMRNVLLLDMAIHTFDAARYMAGEEPLAVYCHESNPKGSWYAHGAAATAIYEFSNDVQFTYRGSWCAEGSNTEWDASWRIIGTKGTLLWDGLDGFKLQVVSGDEGFFRPLTERPVLPPANPAETEDHTSVIRAFLDALDQGHAPETAGTDNIKSLAMVFGAIDSAARKQRVLINPEVQP